jgi:hypothetical protein
MDSKFFVSYEAAKLLKEKGYDDEYIIFYNKNGELIIPYDKEEYHVLYPCTTKAEAIDWLESKGIVVEVNMNYCGLNNWHYILHRENIFETIYSENDDIYFSTRLEAEDAAIIKALELL